MGVVYLPIDGEAVSREWHVVLVDMRRDGVRFNVNEGKRSLSRQQYFWNCGPSGCCCCNNCNLAARPSPFAPHIRVGRIDHAIDFSNDSEVFAWLKRAGLQPARTVRGESWHIEVPASRLRAYARKRGTSNSQLQQLGPIRRKAVGRLLYHRRARAKEARTGRGPRFQRHDRYAKRWYKVVRAYWRRAKPSRQRNILAAALKDRNGWLVG